MASSYEQATMFHNIALTVASLLKLWAWESVPDYMFDQNHKQQKGEQNETNTDCLDRFGYYVAAFYQRSRGLKPGSVSNRRLQGGT